MKPIERGDGRWQVYIPRKLSASGTREAKYFPSKNQAAKFITEFRAEHREHGRSAVTAEQREWIEFATKKLGDLSLLPKVLEHWERSGTTIIPVTAADAVRAFIAEAAEEHPNKRTWHDIEERLLKFAAHFSDRPLRNHRDRY